MDNNFFTLSDQEALLLSCPSDITYVSGFTFLVPEEREAFVLFTQQKKYVTAASFSKLPSDSTFEVLFQCSPLALARHLKDIFTTEKITRLFIDPTSLFLQEYRALEKELTPLPCTLENFSREKIWKSRVIKTTPELTSIRHSSQIASRAFQETIHSLRVGMTEQDVCLSLEKRLRELGSEKPAFPIIVAFGSHSAEPHHQPDSTQLRENTAILIDVGATIDGYRSDMTRTLWFGKTVNDDFLKIQKSVDHAYSATLELLRQRPLPTAQQIDTHARDCITADGYGPHFIHTAGHGIGLDIHEPPSLNYQNHDTIKEHMVITLEPAIYLEGEFGYRYENTILVTSNGAEELTT